MPMNRLAAVILLFAAAPARAGLESLSSDAGASFRLLLETRPAALAPVLARSLSDEDRLIDLLDDSDPSVRAQAARALKNYALTSWRAESKLIDVLDKRGELDAVAREAAKSLAWAAQHSNTRSRLLSAATDSSRSAAVRAIAFKSLYVVSREYDVRSALQSAAEDSSEKLVVRAGAVWTLAFDAANDYRSRQTLLSLADDRQGKVRLEAVKSLYHAMGDWQTRNKVSDLAKDSSLAEPLREAAILCLHAANSDWGVKSFLEDVARSQGSAALRGAAIKALQNGQTLELVRYFHLSMYLGRFIDPLEDQ